MSAPDSPTVSGLPAEKLMAAALGSTPVSSPAFAWAPPAVEEVAPWFPDYEVQSLAGRGAMGAVYRAVQRKLARPVAIKLLPAELATRDGVALRFEREARALAQLNHPGIVALHDFGRTESGHLFIVMEYVDGTDLSRLLHAEGGALGVPQALEIVSQVCDALQYAHNHNFVHRDIKPGNVLVDREGRVKIADFGLAKFIAGNGAAPHTGLEGRATLTGLAVGTPDYTAPEQLRGGPVDHRADIYSLGVMFYEMLTGDLPRGAWTPPSQRTAAPVRLDEVVNRALQSEPDRRYQQASEVKAAVAGRVEEKPSAAGNPRRSILDWIMVMLMLALGAWVMLHIPVKDTRTFLQYAAPLFLLAFVLYRWRPGVAGKVMAGAAILWVASFSYNWDSQDGNHRRAAMELARQIWYAEMELTDLHREYGQAPDHPRIRQVQAKLKALQTALAEEEASSPAEAGKAGGQEAALQLAERRAAALTEGIRNFLKQNSPQQAGGWWDDRDTPGRYELAKYYMPNRPETLEEYLPPGFVFLLPDSLHGPLDVTVHPLGTAKPGERAVADMGALVNEIANFQQGLDHRRDVEGIKRFWTAVEQQNSVREFRRLSDSLLRMIASGFPPEEPAVKEAKRRIEMARKILNEMKLPSLEAGDRLSSDFRSGADLSGLFPRGEDLIHGLRVHCWKGSHPMDTAVYYVESRGIESEKPWLGGSSERDLSHYPDFWPLDMPVERPSLPAGSPQSNAELEWIEKTWPKECAPGGLGLVIAEFEVKEGSDGNPQMLWRRWSRSTEDAIPWAPGEPRPGSAAGRGRMVLKGGKCYTIFDTAPRPQLFGAAGAGATVWASHTLTHQRMPQMLRNILDAKMELAAFLPEPGWQKELHARASGYTLRDSEGFSEEAVKSAPLWTAWQEDFDALVWLQKMNEGTDTPVPFHPWRGGQVLITKFVCSREVAEKIAISCGAQLPVTASQDELDALANLLPHGAPCHSGLIAGDEFGKVLRWKRNKENIDEETIAGDRERAPEGITPTLFSSNGRGVFRTDQPRALLVLEWSEFEKRRVAFVDQWNRLDRALPGWEESVAFAEKNVIDDAVRFRVMDENLPPAMQKAVKDSPPAPVEDPRSAAEQGKIYQGHVREWEAAVAFLRVTREMHQKIGLQLKAMEKQSPSNPNHHRVVLPP